MSLSQIALVLHALVMSALLWALVPVLTTQFAAPWGYVLCLVLYWLGFCLPVIALHVWRGRGQRLFSERLAWRDWFVPIVLLMQVGVVALVLFVPNTAMLTTQAAMLAALLALVHAPLEELAWRGGFLTRFADRPRLGFVLGWLLFTLWHVPLALAQNMVLPGGMPVLVGGAAALGLFWSWIVWRTGSIFWVSIAHVLTSALSLWLLFDANGVGDYQP